jgi:FKBP-type peptidyl-prolyl cis-trans isomerase
VGSDPAPTSTSPDKPTVKIPDKPPTELKVSVLKPGDGPAAAKGDTVVVDYIGVRSADGKEFDNSYDRGQPFPVTLGAGGVIPGWDQGLVGAQAGSQIQLDIPSALAYKDQAKGDVIRANEDLTFVIDVRSVVSPPDPSGEPTEPGVPASTGATEVKTVDLKEGDGAALKAGQTALIELVLFRGDTLKSLDSTWKSGPIAIPLNQGTLPGLLKGLEGMKVGGRRAIIIPPADGFGDTGRPQIGLPAKTDIIIVVDVLGAY